MRLDKALVQLKLADTRNKAQYYIASGVVSVNGKVVSKNSFKVNQADSIEIHQNPCIYVSKGGLKLEKAIQEFAIDFRNKIVIDIGASTGGFTDCALKHGAKKVYSIDVGHNQLHETLINNQKVINLEGVNLKDLTSATIGENVDLIVVDVSFISLSHVFPIIKSICNKHFQVIVLIKPQFELGKHGTNKGVVKDKKKHIEAIKKVIKYGSEQDIYLVNLTFSPYKGEAGNIEFLGLFSVENTTELSNKQIDEVVANAHQLL